jgi:hypothetical protein
MAVDEWDGTWTLHGVSQQFLDDAGAWNKWWTCSFYLMTLSDRPLTEAQSRTGWRWVRHDDHRHKLAVGWRLEKRRQEAEARVESEKAACPYVECICGHHEAY